MFLPRVEPFRRAANKNLQNPEKRACGQRFASRLSSVHARSESAASASHGGKQDRGSRVPDGFDLLIYLTGEPGPDVPSPRVGDPVELRVLRGGLAIEAFSAGGQRIGRLPPA